MAESTLSQQAYADLREAVGRYLGYGADSANWGSASSADTQAYVIEKIIQAGVRQFLFPPPLPGERQAHAWGFLRVPLILTTQAPYSTGTITVVNGVVTLSVAGTFPAWAASGVIVVNGSAYTVNTRDGDNQVTLDDLTVDVDAGTTYELNQRDYDLDDDFGFFEGALTYEPNIYPYVNVAITGVGTIRRLRQSGSPTSGRPVQVAIQHKKLTDATTEGQRKEIMFWPTPDAAYRLTGTYIPLPDKISSTSIFTYGGMQHTECIRESCLAIAERNEGAGQTGGVAGLHWQAFMIALAASISVDRQARPQNLGYNGDASDLRECQGLDRRQSTSPVEYRGAYYP